MHSVSKSFVVSEVNTQLLALKLTYLQTSGGLPQHMIYHFGAHLVDGEGAKVPEPPAGRKSIWCWN